MRHVITIQKNHANIKSIFHYLVIPSNSTFCMYILPAVTKLETTLSRLGLVFKPRTMDSNLSAGDLSMMEEVDSVERREVKCECMLVRSCMLRLSPARYSLKHK